MAMQTILDSGGLFDHRRPASGADLRLREGFLVQGWRSSKTSQFGVFERSAFCISSFESFVAG
jgi:hypothetical protein